MKARFTHSHYGNNRDPHETTSFIYDSFNCAHTLGQVNDHKRWRLIQDQPVLRGVTRCILEDDERNPVAYGYSFCSASDNFSREIGRKIAEGRARAQVA